MTTKQLCQLLSVCLTQQVFASDSLLYALTIPSAFALTIVCDVQQSHSPLVWHCWLSQARCLTWFDKGLKGRYQYAYLKESICWCVADKVRSDVPRVLINREKVGEAEPELKRLGVEHGFNFGEGNFRDVLYLGNCDDGAKELCKLLGWTEDLQKLITESNTAEHEAHNPITKSPSAL